MTIVGPSYKLTTRRASVQSSVGWMLRQVEPGNEKAGFYLQQCPGLTRIATAGAEIRGAWWTGSRAFVVAGSTLYELSSAWGLTARGTLSTSTGPVEFAQGLTQLAIVDGSYGYAYTLSSNTFAQITDGDYINGSKTVSHLDERFLFVNEGTQQFFWSETSSATGYDALSFQTVLDMPGGITGLVVDHREIWVFGKQNTAVYLSTGTDEVFERNQGSAIEQGCSAPYTIRKIDNSIFWLGQDSNGNGIVWRAEGYMPRRVSTHAVEEALKDSTNLSRASAFCYQDQGQTFYCLNAPGLSSTWVYDASTGQWHERAELIAGNKAPWRADVHVFAHGVHIVGDSEGGLYRLNADTYNNDGDPLLRERISPHASTPARRRVFFDLLRLDVEVGETASGNAPVVEMRYSDDGGYTWGNWISRSLGKIGEFSQPVEWRRLGSAKDRVWHVRTTSDARASIINSHVEATEGQT